MKIASFTTVLLLLIGVCMAAAEPNKSNPPPEHKPFIGWIKAIKESDLEAFKAVYSKKMQKRMAKKGWEKILGKYKKGFDKELGDCKPEDFFITFQAEKAGKKNEGKLLIEFKGKKLASLDIIKEEKQWKINEY